jgi:hypothetical protein
MTPSGFLLVDSRINTSGLNEEISMRLYLMNQKDSAEDSFDSLLELLWIFLAKS